ncbi:MAG TPA: hypothetical protein PK389_02415 [Gammaproteobacteria bacterium]|nr:hypothetical protein [Gammaproteobacteria bacterium]
MIRKSLFLILALAILSVPVFSMAHTFTHFTQVDVLDVTETENGDSVDLDEICFDCLALTALNFFLIASGFSLSDSAVYLRPSLLTTRLHSDNKYFPYYSRAPPSPL